MKAFGENVRHKSIYLTLIALKCARPCCWPNAGGDRYFSPDCYDRSNYRLSLDQSDGESKPRLLYWGSNHSGDDNYRGRWCLRYSRVFFGRDTGFTGRDFFVVSMATISFYEHPFPRLRFTLDSSPTMTIRPALPICWRCPPEGRPLRPHLRVRISSSGFNSD